MNTKHTPGPWRIDAAQGEGYCAYISADLEKNRQMQWNNPVICQLYEAKGEPYEYQTVSTAFENSKANARLIACAPELLDVLKSIETHAGTWGDLQTALNLIRDMAYKAIAKAEGNV